MARTNITDDDEGKRVVNAHGDKIGMITEVRAGRAHVDPDPGITDKIRSKLGWGDNNDEDDYVLQKDRIGSITDDEVRLKDNL